MTETALAEQLYACVNQAGNSVDKRRYLIDIPSIVGTLAKEIYNGNYYPERMTVFAIEDPKLREIFAPGFRDRLAQQWLVSIVAPNIERAWIDDSFSNRQGKGTHSALSRLQHFMRQTGHMYYCQMDIRAFSPSIHRPTLLKLWKDQLTRVSCAESTHQLIQQVAGRIILQNPLQPPPIRSGNLSLPRKIPPHQSLFHRSPDVGLPIGSLSSQFFSNVYLNPLDQFIKHSLKIRGYLRYVDDLIILGASRQTLIAQQRAIDDFLHKHLHLQLNPNKTVLQRVNQGANFLSYIVFPHHCYIRDRTLRALRQRIYFFNHLLDPKHYPHVPRSARGS